MDNEVVERILLALEKTHDTASNLHNAGELRTLRADVQQMRISALRERVEIQAGQIDDLRAQNAIQAEQLRRLAEAVPGAGATVRFVQIQLAQ